MSCSNLLLVCTKGKKCAEQHAGQVYRALKKRIAKDDLEDNYEVKKSDCLGLCKYGPVLSFVFEGLQYGKVTKKDCREIIKKHSRGKKPVKKLMIKGDK